MKIEVKNFGKIKKGQVDLDKKVTVFVGYNNSGKTYMSQLLWNLHNRDIILKPSFKGNKYVQDEIVNEKFTIITLPIVSQIIEGFKSHIESAILPDLFNVSTEYFSNEFFSIELIEDFLLKMKKKKFKHLALNLSTQNSNSDTYTEYYSFVKNENSLSIAIEKHTEKQVKIDELLLDGLNNIDIYFNTTPFDIIFKTAISEIIILLLLGENYTPVFLPANRVFYASYYKYIYSVAKEEKDLIDDRLKKGDSLESIRSLSKRPYTKSMDDLIQKIYNLNTNLEIKEEYQDLVIELKKIIGGDIILKSSEGIAPIEFFLQLDDGKELEMYMSSSSANQLIALYLYLKYWVETSNNYLIIDEPEENLHLENQIKLVNILMKFADRGNKILITTHSPLITDHINNYANLSYLNEAGADTEHLLTDNSMNMVSVKNIKHADYGVYFFDGESIIEYEVKDYGAYFKDFQTAEDKVKHMSNILKENIYNNIHSDATREPLQD